MTLVFSSCYRALLTRPVGLLRPLRQWGWQKEKKVKTFVSLGLKQFKHDFTSVTSRACALSLFLSFSHERIAPTQTNGMARRERERERERERRRNQRARSKTHDRLPCDLRLLKTPFSTLETLAKRSKTAFPRRGQRPGRRAS